MSRWVDWHADYDVADSRLARRLAPVQTAIGDALDAVPPGPIRVVSMCAGEARDLLGVVPRHPRRADVVGRLVELDPELARRAGAASPAGIDVRCGDASTTTAYDGAVVWTRHRRAPDRTVMARDAFAAAGFEEIAFTAPAGFLFGVGVHRLRVDPEPYEAGIDMFTFVGYDALDEPRPR